LTFAAFEERAGRALKGVEDEVIMGVMASTERADERITVCYQLI
jgi:hypothetical protein